jgi:hydroxymethylpyrimidine pyrophosphatase-like HAD family hydrolase
VTKGHGLLLLCEKLGVDVGEVIAFGDGENDKEMLEFAGHGCAVYNAKEAAKLAANEVLEVSDANVFQQQDSLDPLLSFYYRSSRMWTMLLQSSLRHC